MPSGKIIFTSRPIQSRSKSLPDAPGSRHPAPSLETFGFLPPNSKTEPSPLVNPMPGHTTAPIKSSSPVVPPLTKPPTSAPVRSVTFPAFNRSKVTKDVLCGPKQRAKAKKAGIAIGQHFDRDGHAMPPPVKKQNKAETPNPASTRKNQPLGESRGWEWNLDSKDAVWKPQSPHTGMVVNGIQFGNPVVHGRAGGSAVGSGRYEDDDVVRFGVGVGGKVFSDEEDSRDEEEDGFVKNRRGGKINSDEEDFGDEEGDGFVKNRRGGKIGAGVKHDQSSGGRSGTAAPRRVLRESVASDKPISEPNDRRVGVNSPIFSWEF